MSRQELDLGRIMELSSLMLDGAKKLQWDAVIELHQVREPLLREFFAGALGIEQNVIADSIQQILVIDQEILELGRIEKSQVKSQLKNIANGKTAVKAYMAR